MAFFMRVRAAILQLNNLPQYTTT